jgi:hypothetical protein
MSALIHGLPLTVLVLAPDTRPRAFGDCISPRRGVVLGLHKRSPPLRFVRYSKHPFRRTQYLARRLRTQCACQGKNAAAWFAANASSLRHRILRVGRVAFETPGHSALARRPDVPPLRDRHPGMQAWPRSTAVSPSFDRPEPFHGWATKRLINAGGRYNTRRGRFFSWPSGRSAVHCRYCSRSHQNECPWACRKSLEGRGEVTRRGDYAEQSAAVHSLNSYAGNYARPSGCAILAEC